MTVELFFKHFGLEVFGTMLLILLGNGVVANVVLKNTKGNNGGWIVITAGWGFAVFAGAAASSALGGVAHLNPAVTVANAIDRTWFNQNGWGLLPAILLGQIVGAIIGQLLVDTMYWLHIRSTVEKDPFAVLGMHGTIPQNRNIPINLANEFIGTFVLIVGILAMSRSASLVLFMPIFVGILVFAIGLSLGGATGYAINPVRDFVPRLVHWCLPIKNKGTSDWQYAFVPVVAPLLAGVVGGLIFNYV